MSNAVSLLHIIDEQEEIVMALEDPRIDESAKRIAYYSAMIDAAEDDPMDDPQDQDDVLTILRERLKQHVEFYRNLVNEHL